MYIPVNLAATAGPSSFILHKRASRYHWEGEGLLSIKSFRGGRALYDAGLGRHAVDDRSYLLLNNGRRYAITIDAERPVESFCIFFEPGFAEEVARTLRSTTGALLDEPLRAGENPVELFEHARRHDDAVSPLLFQLRAALPDRASDGMWLAERMHMLMVRLLESHHGSLDRAGALPSVRPATRRELYRRLLRARDYADACFDREVTLNDMARVATLSPNHFLRGFRSAFGVTPHQYLTSVRIEHACGLLAGGEMPVGEIALRVGFESIGSFSWLFRKRMGCSPAEYRREAMRGVRKR